jgi:predicted TIM-barrel fold metal-dependent hydrolase
VPYAEGRIIHDADSHIMEEPDWLAGYADPAIRPRLARSWEPALAPGEGAEDQLAKIRREHADPAFRAEAAERIMLRRNFSAHGSFLKEDRPEALDMLGFASQLVFNTFNNGALQKAEHAGDLDLAYGMALAHNRAIVDFCSVDGRLLPVGYVPLADLERAPSFAGAALAMGCKALMVASACPPGHSPTHVRLDAVWAQAAEARVPVVLHVGGGGRLIEPGFFNNGLPPVPDFHGGDGNFRSIDYVAIQYPVMQFLAAFVIDGVLARFPDLRVGVIEQGATWFPGLLRTLDSAADAFRKNEQRLQDLELLPSEYLRRQVRVTPYPHEDAGWCIEQGGDEVMLFSSDWPHVEGGRNPLGRFERSLARLSDAARQRFYCDNFCDLMGPHVPSGGRPARRRRTVAR